MGVLTLKLQESKLGLFNRVPLSLYRQKYDGRRFSPSAYALSGKIYNFSNTSDTDSSCRLTYDQVREEFGWARSTTASAFEQLRTAEKVKKIDRDQDGTAYVYVDRLKGQYDNIPQYLFTAEIFIGGECRRMTLSEIRVLGRLMTECSYAGNGGTPTGGGTYYVSNKKLARILNLSETTIKKAIRALLKAKLIFRSKENKGKNRYKLSGYQVARECYLYKKYAVKRKKTVVNVVPKEIKDANYRADRERYYAKRRDLATSRAELILAQANKNSKFKTNSTSLSLIEIALAKAEILTPKDLPKIQRQQKELQAERLDILASMGIKEEDLRPKWACEKCSDTGFLPNGRACGCYDPPDDGI